MWRPVRIVCLKSLTVHKPRPVSLSGVRLAVKLTPQGPAQAVLVPAETIIQGPSGRAGTGGICRPSGWPDSIRVMSGSAPFGPAFNGVWQSMHAEVATRYLPRAALAAVVGLSLSAACAGGVTA